MNWNVIESPFSGSLIVNRITPFSMAAQALLIDRIPANMSFVVRSSNVTNIRLHTGDSNDVLRIAVTEDVSSFATVRQELDGRASLKRLDKVELYFKGKALAYIDESRRCSALIVTEDINERGAVPVIPLLAPWFFDGDPLNDVERDLIRASQDATADRFIAIAHRIWDESDRRRKNQEQSALDFVHDITNHEITSAKSRLGYVNSQYQDYLDSAKRMRREMRKLELMIFALEYERDDDDLRQFVLSNKSLVFEPDMRCNFFAKTTLSNFDPDYAERAIQSGAMRRLFHMLTPEDADNFVRAVFVDQEVTVRVQGAFYVEQEDTADIPARSGTSLNDTRYMPNPHLYHYGCRGDYGPEIVARMGDCDYAGALSACIASTGSLNLAESPTMQYFAADLFMESNGFAHYKCCVLPDGRDATAREVVEYLRTRGES